MWTNHERHHAQARALKQCGHAYILPVRVNNTVLLGLPPTLGYLSLSEYSIDQIADLLIQKLSEEAPPPAAPAVAEVTTHPTETNAARLTSARPTPILAPTQTREPAWAEALAARRE